ncbi:MAG TPA: DMT family transporter [Candidatus Binatia bacterium]|nr:DMT family transporter [Candidatus Binatia bacterium]
MSRGDKVWWWRGAALGVVLVWSSCFIAIKGLLGTAPPLLAAGSRALMAALVLLPLAALAGKLVPPRSAWPWLVALGLANTTVGLAGMFLSVGLAGAALPAVFANSQALLVAPAAVWLFREPLRPRAVAGLVAGTTGVAILFGGSVGVASGTTAGALLGIGSALGLAAGNLLMKRLSREVPALPAVAWQYLVGAVGLLAWSALTEDLGALELTPGLGASLVYLGVVGSAGASWAWYRLLARDSLIGLNGLTLLTPVLAVGWASLLFGERLGGLGLVGLALAVAGVGLVSLPDASAE